MIVSRADAGTDAKAPIVVATPGRARSDRGLFLSCLPPADRCLRRQGQLHSPCQHLPAAPKLLILLPIRMQARGSAASVRRSPAGSPGKTDAICLNIAHRKPVMAFRAAADRKPVVTQAWRRAMMSLPDVHFRQRLFAPATRPRACDMARGFLPCPGPAGSGRIAPPEPGTISSVRTLML